jgi:TPR repeat protein
LLCGGRDGVFISPGAVFGIGATRARRGCEEDRVRSLELARESAGKGSRYGQFTLGKLLFHGQGGAARDTGAAFALFRLAATFDGAQCDLGDMYRYGWYVAPDHTEALRCYQLAAAQGFPKAIERVAYCHQHGIGVPADPTEAIRWYRRAQAAGDPDIAACASSSMKLLQRRA